MGKADRVKARTRKNSRRTFHGNRFTRKAREQQIHTPTRTDTPDTNNADIVFTTLKTPCSASESRVQNILTNTPQQTDPKITGYRF